MAISKKRRPVALITGKVLGVEPKPEYGQDGKQTGEVGRFDVTLVQPSFAVPDVRFPAKGFNVIPTPEVGAEVALIVELGETDEYGANLRILRYATDDDLESAAQKLPALAAK